MTSEPSLLRRFFRGSFRWTVRIVLGVILAAVLLGLVVGRSALYNRFVAFPKQAAAWEEIRAKRVATTLEDGYNEYRGVLHSHSFRSHDSQVTAEEVVAAAKVADLDFLFMSDHCVEKQADYKEGLKGLHEGVMFYRGYEMGYGFMPWGLPDSVVLDCSQGPVELAQQIGQNGGLLFFAHSEEEREWDLPELTGMEIYNIHTDFKGESYQGILPDVLVNIRSYPDQMIRSIFDRQDKILEHWDELNKTRKIVGISANDAHQNNGVQAIYTEEGNLIVQSTSGSDGEEWQLNTLTRFFVGLLPGKLEPGARVFYFTMDPYERSLRFVNTHLLAKEHTYDALLDALKNGRAFIAFDMLCDARTFGFVAQSATAKATMGEVIPWSSDLKLFAASPTPCRFTLKCDGEQLAQSEGTTFEFTPAVPGKYRVEAELNILGEWTPWVYTNPLEIIAPDGSAPSASPVPSSVPVPEAPSAVPGAPVVVPE